ncbi:MAG: hypothetical protein IT370_12420 [Deltaproteobacteria bacterium]|nr:hypothetical protein [Deltaproteobacteria bacterium]
MTRPPAAAALLALALALASAGCSKDDPGPELRGRAGEPALRPLEETEWLGPAPSPSDAWDGGNALPAPERPWTVRCPALVDHLAALTRATLAADGAPALELGQLDRRAALERGSDIARCVARASAADLDCLLAAHSSAALAACHTR